jgi:hypothetical protein
MQKKYSSRSRASKPGSLIAAALDVLRWEDLKISRLRSCGDAGKCADARCRRRKHCYKRQWIDAEIAASRARMVAARRR